MEVTSHRGIASAEQLALFINQFSMVSRFQYSTQDM
jgi:hypothetical protein